MTFILIIGVFLAVLVCAALAGASHYDEAFLRDHDGLDGRIRANKMDWRSWFCRFGRGFIFTAKKGGAAATGSTGDTNMVMICGGPAPFCMEQHIKGTQTIITPVNGSYGLDMSQDLTDNDGVEYTLGNLVGPSFKIGTSSAFYTRAKFVIPDVSGTDQLFVGFRKQQAYQTAIASYTDYAVIGNVSGDIKTQTLLNNAGGVTTDTTDDWADAGVHTLEVRVTSAGVVTYLLDGHAPTAVAAFTFDDTDQVVPFIWFLHDSDVAQGTEIITWEGGHLAASPGLEGAASATAM